MLEHALITAPERRDPALLAKLDVVAGRVLQQARDQQRSVLHQAQHRGCLPGCSLGGLSAVRVPRCKADGCRQGRQIRPDHMSPISRSWTRLGKRMQALAG